MYSFPCEYCHTVIYSKEKNKRSKSGFPNYFVCDYCYNWSIRIRDRPLAKVLQGTIERPKSSGKKFSREWQNKYVQKVPTKKRNGENKNDTKNEEDMEKNGGIIATAVETIKDDINAAVAVVESGVSGLVQGVTDAFSSLTTGTSEDK